ncbi:hypothetical protein D3C80_2092770 [compost metagenome]
MAVECPLRVDSRWRMRLKTGQHISPKLVQLVVEWRPAGAGEHQRPVRRHQERGLTLVDGVAIALVVGIDLQAGQC